MITADGLPKILDFGIARPAGTVRAERPDDALATGVTLDGAVVGTKRYMAPEQLSGGAVDHRADQFAFGVLLYEMLTGRSPFPGPTLSAVVAAILTHEPPPLRQVRSDTPVELEAIARRCLAKQLESRYDTSIELAASLHECVERHTRARYGLHPVRHDALVDQQARP